MRGRRAAVGAGLIGLAGLGGIGVVLAGTANHPSDARHHAQDEPAQDEGHRATHSSGLLAADPSHVAARSGSWTSADTWKDGRVPGDGAAVQIPAETDVTVDGVIAERLESLQVEGSLSFAPSVDTELRVDTLLSTPGGKVEIGSEAAPIAPDATARVVFVDDGPVDPTADPEQLGRGAVLQGTTVVHGAEKTAWSSLARQPRAGDSALSLPAPPRGWRVGDELVVAGTDPDDPASDEKVAVAALDGRTVTLDRPLALDHVAPAADLDVHVANLTRNVELTSESIELERRGHVMFMHTLDVDVRYAAFDELGRTNKRVQLDDVIFPDLDGGPRLEGPKTNVRGRYSIHFHRGGSDISMTPARVEGSVVTGDPGWAYVNHSSNVDFVRNVSYDVVGGAFQTEAGDEQGSFVENIALRTVNPELPLRGSDEGQLPDLREDRQDFAWQGDAFWLHGGGPRVEGNVAAGVSGHAFIYWPEGLVEGNAVATTMEAASVPNGELADSSALPLHWVPVSSFSGNQGYATTRGLEIFYLHSTFFGDEEEISPAYRRQLGSTFEDSTFWGVQERALGVQYGERLTFSNLRLVNGGQREAVGIDADHFHNLNSLRFEHVDTSGFGVGFKVPTQGRIVVSGGRHSNLVDLEISNPQRGSRQLDLADLSFDESPLFPDAAGSPRIRMAPDFSPLAPPQLRGETLEEDFEDLKGLLFFLEPDRITLRFGEFDGLGLYFDQQAGSAIPMTRALARARDAGDGEIPSRYVGRSNAVLDRELGLSFGGALIPPSAQAVDLIAGGLVGPAAGAPRVLPPDLHDGDEPDDGEFDPD